MSDGMSDGYRAAREHEARQRRVDEFFGMVAECVRGGFETMDGDAFRAEFEAFDAFRHADSVARYRLQKTVRKRWKAFKKTLADAKEAMTDDSWAEIFSLALRYASRDVTARLLDLSAFEGHLVALYVPEGRGREPSLYGDHAAALDAAAQGGLVTVIAVEDSERAIVALDLGAKGGEILDPERAKLRFIAVRPKEGG